MRGAHYRGKMACWVIGSVLAVALAVRLIWGSAPYREYRARAFIEQRGGHVSGSAYGPVWLRELVERYTTWPFQRIENVSFVYLPVRDDDLAVLSDLPNLKRLELNLTGISDAGLRHVGRIRTLHAMTITEPTVTDAGINELEHLTALNWLSLEESNVTDACLKSIGKLTSLQGLTLHRTAIEGRQLGELKRLPGLRVIILGGRANDASLAPLSEITTLTSVDLSGTQVTDAGMPSLERLPDLQFLKLRYSRVTQAALNRLQAKNPALVVDWSPQ